MVPMALPPAEGVQHRLLRSLRKPPYKTLLRLRREPPQWTLLPRGQPRVQCSIRSSFRLSLPPSRNNSNNSSNNQCNRSRRNNNNNNRSSNIPTLVPNSRDSCLRCLQRSHRRARSQQRRQLRVRDCRPTHKLQTLLLPCLHKPNRNPSSMHSHKAMHPLKHQHQREQEASMNSSLPS